MGEIPRDLAQSLGGGWGQVLSFLPVVLGLGLWGLCLGILSKRGQRVPGEGTHGVSWGGYLLQLDEGELHVRALGDLVLIPGRWGGRRRGARETHTEPAQLDVVDLATVCLTLLGWSLRPLQSLWCLVAVRKKGSLP